MVEIGGDKILYKGFVSLDCHQELIAHLFGRKVDRIFHHRKRTRVEVGNGPNLDHDQNYALAHALVGNYTHYMR